MSEELRVLWIGDAACESGFAVATHGIGKRVVKYCHFAALGINSRGMPNTDLPFDVYPCWPGKDMFGLGMLHEVLAIEKPDVVVIQNDPWNVRPYFKKIYELVENERPKTVIGAIAIDGLNCKASSLNAFDAVIFWTDFARLEAFRGGLIRRAYTIPLGVDLNIYHPGDRIEARHRIDMSPIPDNAFVVTFVGRNQPRKRLDLLIEYFAEWVHQYNVQDAYLHLHVAPTGDVGVDIDQLVEWNEISRRVLLVSPRVWHGMTRQYMADVYRAADVFAATTQGEGFGLPALEAMACGTPCVLPRWSGYGEWADDAAAMVPCTQHGITFGGPNVIGGVPDKKLFIEALQTIYSNESIRTMLSEKGLELAAKQRYRWDFIGDRYWDIIENTHAQNVRNAVA